jgi:hypothetical protein
MLFLSILLQAVNTNTLAYQDGWTAANIMDMTDNCVASILNPVREGFEQQMNAQGRDDAEFPEKQFKQPITDFCACITFRAADVYEYQQVRADPKLTQSYMTEAIKGGQCKPTGLFADVMSGNHR